ncbi:MAG: hypoxanthine phosphoribosyltransferase [Candidatus Magasanikbacteria bacterium]|nr:hypoxanthine phosphoribosyltransferase [Candidatus Magasanikbacteria bacterium]
MSDYKIKKLISGDEIQIRAKEMGRKIAGDFEGRPIHVVVVQLGAWMFGADLIKNIPTNQLTLDSIQLSSYKGDTESCGLVTVVRDLVRRVKGQDVLVVEDIVDTGRTISELQKNLKRRGAASVQVATMLNKQDGREIDFEPDYVGFEIQDCFVIGYGLDYQERFRNLPYVAEMVFC